MKFRSKYEKRIKQNSSKKVEYEPISLQYTLVKKYTPDFRLPNGILVEAKGNFRSTAERTKMIAIKKQNPDVEIRFLFQNAKLKIRKGSKTTYAMWAEKNGFKWAEGEVIPPSWLKENI